MPKLPRPLLSGAHFSRDPEPDAPRPLSRRAMWWEIALVFAITLGMSALRSLLSLLDALSAPVPLAAQSVTIVAPQAQADFLDLLRQLCSIALGIAWGALGVYLLWRGGVNLADRLGLRGGWRDVPPGLGLAALIGIPGLGLYMLSYAMGFSLQVQAAALNDVWWRIPVLILAALQNGVAEEFLVIGYLLTRLEQLRVPVVAMVAFSAVLRGSYHLYQGFGGFVGNLAMGIVFALVFLHWRRIWPLVIAHTLLDTVTFVGYPLAKSWGWVP